MSRDEAVVQSLPLIDTSENQPTTNGEHNGDLAAGGITDDDTQFVERTSELSHRHGIPRRRSRRGIVKLEVVQSKSAHDDHSFHHITKWAQREGITLSDRQRRQTSEQVARVGLSLRSHSMTACSSSGGRGGTGDNGVGDVIRVVVPCIAHTRDSLASPPLRIRDEERFNVVHIHDTRPVFTTAGQALSGGVLEPALTSLIDKVTGSPR